MYVINDSARRVIKMSYDFLGAVRQGKNRASFRLWNRTRMAQFSEIKSKVTIL